jgi:uncharacterized protein
MPSTEPQEGKTSPRIPLRFFVVTFLWSWIIWVPLALAGLGVLQLDTDLLTLLAIPAAMLGAFGPAVGACVAVWTLEGRAALAAFLRRFLSLRFGWKAWLAMFVVLGAVNGVAWFIPELWGHERPPMLLPTVLVLPIYWLVMVFLGGGQEEVGWRGYILEPLEARFGLWGGNVVLGVVWSVWHGPLWFVPGSTQASIPFVAFTIGTIGLSFFFSWLMKASGGRPLAGLMVHGTFNAFIVLFPDDRDGGGPLAGALVAASGAAARGGCPVPAARGPATGGRSMGSQREPEIMPCICSISNACSSMSAFTRSPIDTRPMRRSSSSTGRWRRRPSVMRAMQVATLSSGAAVWTGALITSRTRVSREARPRRMTLRA